MTDPRRIPSVDIVRGVMMSLMMIDHVREFFFLHRQVADPVDLGASGLALFFTRAASHPCAPAFVFLAGLSAALRSDRRGEGPAQTARYLARRGFLLVLMELTVVNFAWTFQFPPSMVYLQVIWAIGLSMIALAGLVFLPARALLATALVIVLGHDLLRHVPTPADGPGFLAAAVLIKRSLIHVSDGLTLRTSYPVLPYIGVIALGYAAGRLYTGLTSPGWRRAILFGAGAGCLALFAALRVIGIYGEPSPFVPGDSAVETLASFLNTTKYPPSLLFLLMTLGPTLILLALAESLQGRRAAILARFGAAPMLYYLLHLYVLHLAKLAAAAVSGASGSYQFEDLSSVWVTSAVSLALHIPLTLFVAGWLKGLSNLLRAGRRPPPPASGTDATQSPRV